MERTTRRQYAVQRQHADTDKSRDRNEALRRLQARVRLKFQDAERMYRQVEERWKHRGSVPTETSVIHERVS